MTLINKFLTSVFFSLFTLILNAQVVNTDSLRFEVLLNNDLLNDLKLDPKFINSISISSSRVILLSTIDQFYVLGWGGIAPFEKKLVEKISAYDFTPENSLLIISKNYICKIDSTGNLYKHIKLPNEGMGISAGKLVMYVYDQSKDKKQNSLYLIARGGKYAKLFDITTPINSVAEMNDSLLFATENILYSYNFKNKSFNILAALPNKKEIKSITVNTSNNRIYFSTDSIVYSIKESTHGIVVDKFGGILKFFNDGLIVFNPEKKLLVRIMGIENEITSKLVKTYANNIESNEIIDNNSIIKMVKDKLSDDIIIKVINNSNVDFNINSYTKSFLTKQNVSAAVISAMENAMKNNK